MPYNSSGPGAEVPVNRIFPITSDFIGDTTKGGNNNLSTFTDLRRGCKGPVRVATTTTLPAYTRVANVITCNTTTSLNNAGIDGVTNLAVSDRVLLKNGAAGADNGIYAVTTVGSTGTVAFVLTRAADFDVSIEAVPGCLVPVSEGTANGNGLFQLTTDAAITLNTTALTFATAIPVATAGGLNGNLAHCADVPTAQAVTTFVDTQFVFINNNGLYRFAAGDTTIADGQIYISIAAPAGNLIMELAHPDLLFGYVDAVTEDLQNQITNLPNANCSQTRITASPSSNSQVVAFGSAVSLISINSAVMFTFSGTCTVASTNVVMSFSLFVDGVQVSTTGDWNVMSTATTTEPFLLNFDYLVTNLTPGSHTYQLFVEYASTPTVTGSGNIILQELH